MAPLAEQLTHALHLGGLRGPLGVRVVAEHLARSIQQHPAGTQRVLVEGLRVALLKERDPDVAPSDNAATESPQSVLAALRLSPGPGSGTHAGPTGGPGGHPEGTHAVRQRAQGAAAEQGGALLGVP